MKMRLTPRLAVALAAVCLLVYLPVFNNGFVDYDDESYITSNPSIKLGFTWSGLRWAFTTHHMGSWHPLTWLSHMLDIELFGQDARGHHLINLLLHTANTVLLFLFLQRATGAPGAAALVAALFAVHPLHVESVAWASERKDVLSTLFWLLTTAAYLRYLRRPRAGVYLVTVALMAIGLLAKPMLVTLPFTLLLFDVWPLGRLKPWSGAGPAGSLSPARALMEKAPLLILAGASCVATYVSQQTEGAIRPTDYYPFSIRLNNALVSYIRYLGKTVWPSGLTILYPHPRHSLSFIKVAAAVIALLVVSAAALRLMRRRPYIPVGWLWYLGTLVPVIGLVQVGAEAMSDRYTYVPHIGLFIILAWGLYDLARRFPSAKSILITLTGASLGILMVLTWIQVGYWRDGVVLFRHAIEVTKDNWQGHLNLGIALARRGRPEEAKPHYQELLRLKPDYARSHAQLGMKRPMTGKLEAAIEGSKGSMVPGADKAYRQGMELEKQGRFEEAARLYTEALDLDPRFADARYSFANTLSQIGRLDEALVQYDLLLGRQPDHWAGHNNLGVALSRLDRLAEAEEHFRKSLRLNPRNPDALNNLGMALIYEERYAEAVGQLRESLRIRPNDSRTMVNFAEALLRTGQRAEAEGWLREALLLEPGNARAQVLLRETLGGRR